MFSRDTAHMREKLEGNQNETDAASDGTSKVDRLQVIYRCVVMMHIAIDPSCGSRLHCKNCSFPNYDCHTVKGYCTRRVLSVI